MGKLAMRLATKACGVALAISWIAITACTHEGSADAQPSTSHVALKASILDASAPSGPSVNGTTIPTAAQIIDSGNNVWTVSGGVYENGKLVTPGTVTLLMYDNDNIFQEDGAGVWWSWNGTTWVLSSNPTLIASPAGTSLPTANQITDGSGNVWAVSSDRVYENGLLVNPTTITQLLFDNGAIYLQDSAGIWWLWNGAIWSASTNPTAVASPAGTSIPAATQITDSSGNVWAVVGGVVYENGALAGYSNAVTALVYQNGALYQQNAAGSWWSWSGNAWVVSGDPTGGSTGSATLSWTPPTQNTDQTPLTNLAGYTIYYGLSASALTQSIQLADPSATSYTVGNLGAATYYFAVAAYSSLGWEGANSAVVSKTIPAASD
jgi:hypothetical protein